MSSANGKGFFQLTPAIGEALRKAKLSSAEWRVWSYLVEVDPWGDRYQKIETLEIMQKCEVSKATLYRVLARLQELELFDFQDKGFNVRNLKGVSNLMDETKFLQVRQDSHGREKSLMDEKKFSQVRQDSHGRENRAPKPSPVKRSTFPQTKQTNKTISDTTELEPGGGVLEIFEKYGESLKTYAVYIRIRQGELIVLNPKFERIIQQIGHVPPTKIDAGIRAFLAWIRNAKDVKDQYKALEVAISRGWE